MWSPQGIVYSLNTLQTSTGVVRVMTDVGVGYLKALGNSQGPHALVREFIGTSVAQLLGLKTLEFSLINIQPDDEIILGYGTKAQPGPAFITKELPNAIQDMIDLKFVTNKDDFGGLVLADTLLLNRDRYPGIISGKPNYDNLLFFKTEQRNRYEIIAMDFSHCMYTSPTIGKTLKNIDNTKKEVIYGLFPEFREYMDFVTLKPYIERLKFLDEGQIDSILCAIPSEWEFNMVEKGIVKTFLVDRTNFLYDNIERLFEVEIKKEISL